MLHVTLSRSAQAWSVLNGITQSWRASASTDLWHYINILLLLLLPATHTFYTRTGKATPGNLHPQSSTAVTHC